MREGNAAASAKKTLVIGAVPGEGRYANKAVHRLRETGHPVLAFGLEDGTVGDVQIETSWEQIMAQRPIDTVTLYVAPRNQKSLISKVIELHPRRIIFNPGAENKEFVEVAEAAGIECLYRCTLIMVASDEF